MPLHADLVVVNARILTMDPAKPQAEALALRGGRLVAVGSRAEAEALKGPGTEVIDAGGRVLLPGFVDAHTHLVQYGMQLLRLNLGTVRSVEECLERVKERAQMTMQGGWVVGHSWDEMKWDRPLVPTREQLDRIAPDKPVVLIRVDIHSVVVNSEALRRAGMDPAVHPTGFLTEHDAYRITDLVKPTVETHVKGLERAARALWERGITSVHAIVDHDDVDALQRARDKGSLPVRTLLYYRVDDLEHLLALKLHRGFGDAWLRVGGLKLFTDGSIGSRTAAISFPYRGSETNKGMFIYDDKKLFDLAARAHAGGLQLAIHCIGDAAVDQALRAIDHALSEHPSQDVRHRLEHLELFTDKDAQRMKELGVIASCQPNFIGEWGHAGQMYADRLGAEIVGKHNRLAVLKRLGIPIAFGSDHMPTGPLYGIHCAVNAPTPDQRLNVEEALYAYTRGAAYGGFLEREVGTLAPGYFADFIVLDKDPRDHPTSVKDVQVLLTVLDGRVVHRLLPR
ncbi:MAG TPA: amidohydrolase [Candidatus Thermoplasmatota archaeon]|nr:amidohydrolase [Candidatus Thermoplasmatota archaeon]